MCNDTNTAMDKKELKQVFDFGMILSTIGNLGRWQFLVFVLVCSAKFSLALHNMIMPLLGATPDHWCRVPELDDLPIYVQRYLSIPMKKVDNKLDFSRCKVYVARNYSELAEIYQNESFASVPASLLGNTVEGQCQHGWIYDIREGGSTLVTEWDLVCGKEWLAASAQAIYMLGFLVGCIIPAYLADVKGRKWTFILTCIVFAVSATVAAFSTNFTWFLLFRFFIGASGSAAVNSSYIYVLENVGPQYRNRVTNGVGIAYCLGYALNALCAYFIRDWRSLQLSISVHLFLLPAWYFFIPESPRWLYAEGRVDDCDKALRRVAKTNKKTYPEHVELKLDAKKHMIVTADGSAREPNYTDILRTPNMRKKSVNMMYQWFVVSLVYYGLAMNSANLGTDPYISFAASALVGIPANVFSAIILKYLGRRLSLSGTMLLAGITCLVTALPWPANLNWVIVALATIGMFASSGTYGICYLYSGELYPTVVRNIGLGSNSTWARVSAILAPYVALLGFYRREYPLLIFGVLAISAGIAALFLPETKDQELPETLEDGENFGKKQRFWTLLPQKPPIDNNKCSRAEHINQQ